MSDAVPVPVPFACVVGIDPGLAGGVAYLLVDERGAVVGAQLHETPTVVVRRGMRSRREYDVRAMWRLLRDTVPVPSEIVIESAGARPRQGIASTFRTGYGAGLWLGLAAARELPYRIVQPQVWKRACGLLGASKPASRLRAAELVPSVRVFTDGTAEALLIAAYGALRWQRYRNGASC
jgi:crossover junction endodeoxyribonuclease RuvC